MSTHYSMANGWWPNQGIHYRKPVSWLPARSVRFDHLVEHLSQRILHRHADPHLHEACRKAVGIAGHEQITKDHPLVQWEFGILLSTLLDSPDFFRK
jgi:hypothetical protein